MSDAKRKEINSKIEAGKSRHEQREASVTDRLGERAIEAKDGFTRFAHEHPIATVAGGLAIGILISGMFKKSPTRKAGAKAAGLAAVGAELALAFAKDALEAAEQAGRTGANKLDGLGETLAGTARSMGRDAGHVAGNAADTARTRTRNTAARIAQAVLDRTR